MNMEINMEAILKDNDARLREKSADVEFPLSVEDRDLLVKLFTYVDESTNPEIAEKKNLRPAVGIAAIQVGVAKKMCAVICEDDKSTEEKPLWHAYALVNPKIVSYSAKKAYLKGGEGCLSVEGQHPGYVVRSARIKVEGYDLLQEKHIVIRASGYPAIVLQHEIDHFDGILFYDRINALDPLKEVEDALVIE